MHKAIRYIGSKQKVLPFLEENLFKFLTSEDLFFDGFVGTGIVSQYIAEKYPNVTISGSDISLYSNVLFDILNIGKAFNSNEDIKILVEEFNKEELISGFIFNEFSNGGVSKSFTESRNFFHEKSGKTIDTFKAFIVKKLNNNEITIEQSSVLLYFLLSYSCKVANTTSVFGAFLKGEAKYVPLDFHFIEKILKNLNEIKKLETKSNFYLGDIVNNLKKIPKQNVIYLDPPYSTRRYESNYHILNFIVDLKFTDNYIKSGSKTGQAKISIDNAFSSKKKTEIVFSDMIVEAVNKSNLLGISYNTDGIITQEWMELFCKEKNYILDTKSIVYKRFKSKTEVTNTEQLQEILWLIKKQWLCLTI